MSLGFLWTVYCLFWAGPIWLVVLRSRPTLKFKNWSIKIKLILIFVVADCYFFKFLITFPSFWEFRINLLFHPQSHPFCQNLLILAAILGRFKGEIYLLFLFFADRPSNERTNERASERARERMNERKSDIINVFLCEETTKYKEKVQWKSKKKGISGIFPAISARKKLFSKIRLDHVLIIPNTHLCAAN